MLQTAQDPIPGHYQQVLYWTLKDKSAAAILLTILSFPLFLLLVGAFWFLGTHIGKLPDSRQFGVLEVVMLPIGIVLTIILHELVHGLSMRWLGARPRYGVLWKQLMFSVTAPDYRFRRNAYLLEILAPLVGLSCLMLLGMFLLQGTNWVALLAIWAAVNGSGALGDLWLVSLALRYPKTAFVVDEKNGIRVFMQKE